jgi:CHAT domain-containing protein
MVDWQLQQGRFDLAFSYAERGRARVLLNEIRAADAWRGDDASQDSIARIRRELEGLEFRLQFVDSDQGPEGAAEIQERIGQLETEALRQYEQLRDQSRTWHRCLNDHVDRETFQDAVIPDSGLALVYNVGETASYLFVIPSTGEPEALRLVLGVEEAEILGEDVRPGPLTSAALRSYAARYGVGSEKGLATLFHVLMPESVWPRVQRSRIALVIPDDWLFQLPFEALVISLGSGTDSHRYWLDEGPPIVYAQSATALDEIARTAPQHRAGKRGYVLSVSDAIYDFDELEKLKGGLPAATSRTAHKWYPYGRFTGRLSRLPGTARETQAIEDAFPAIRGSSMRVLTDTAATERELRNALEGARFIHIGTHGLVRQSRASLFAGLALTPPLEIGEDATDDGMLRLSEVYQLHLPEAELVVLSACQTNVGKSYDSEGVFSLARGFVVAGAPRVVASFWRVSDASTAIVIGDFFHTIAVSTGLGRRIDFATALRDAKRVVRETPGFAEPLFWAPMVLVGTP